MKMSDLLWTPREHRLGDITIIRVSQHYHLFTEQSPLQWNGAMGDAFAGIRSVGHAVSKDMFEWEELPPAIHCGPPGSFDAYSIYHMDVFIHEGTWYMYYTGLDKGGPGEQQSVGLATSRDGIHWEKYPDNPVLRADPRWYEQRIPREAAYQEKDFDRLWFRDPFIIQNPRTGQFGMIVIARDKSKHPDVRACLAWATSDDLICWKPHPPIYSPGRFHTIESPSMFEHDDRHYIMFMTAKYWGTPIITTDPYQDAGNFYAVSRNGIEGPYEAPEDEHLTTTPKQLRMGATRTVQGPAGGRYYYGWLALASVGGDAPPARRTHTMVVPPPRRVRFLDDGQMQVVWHEGLERFTHPIALPLLSESPAFGPLDGGITGKNFHETSIALYPGDFNDLIFSARVRFIRGERAGLVLRASGQTGWQVVVDRKRRRVEFGILGQDQFIDARAWTPCDEVEIKVVAYQESVEVYLDNRLMIHQVRHRETVGKIGYFVEFAEANFTHPQLRMFNPSQSSSRSFL
jgi:beta-fructofuranosidase